MDRVAHLLPLVLKTREGTNSFFDLSEARFAEGDALARVNKAWFRSLGIESCGQCGVTPWYLITFYDRPTVLMYWNRVTGVRRINRLKLKEFQKETLRLAGTVSDADELE